MKSTISKAALAVLGCSWVVSAQAVDFDVKVTNLTHGMYLSPVLVATHPAASSVYSLGSAASNNMKAMAEGGDSSGLQTELIGAGSDTPQILNGTVNNKIPPGGDAEQLGLSSSPGNDRITVVTKLMPTNDGFAALNAIILPTEPGRYVYKMDAFDAGSEANDELMVVGGNTVGVQGIEPDPDITTTGTGGTGASGSDNNATIHTHRGVLGDSNSTGGSSDLDNTIHRWLNPVARVIITVN